MPVLVRQPPCAVVFGGRGFVGKYLVQRLVGAHHYVRVVSADVTPVAQVGRDDDGATQVVCDVRDPAAVTRLIDTHRPEAVFLLAAIVDTRSGLWHDARMRAVNVGGTSTVVRCCKAAGDGCVKRLVFASSTAAVTEHNVPARVARSSSRPQPRWDEGALDSAFTDMKPITTYGSTKLASERIVLAASSPLGSAEPTASGAPAHPSLLTVALRPHVVFGAGDPLFTDVALGAPVATPRMCNGNAIGTMIYVKNLAHWFVLADAALASPDAERVRAVAGRAFFVGNGPDEHVPFARMQRILLAARHRVRQLREAAVLASTVAGAATPVTDGRVGVGVGGGGVVGGACGDDLDDNDPAAIYPGSEDVGLRPPWQWPQHDMPALTSRSAWFSQLWLWLCGTLFVPGFIVWVMAAISEVVDFCTAGRLRHLALMMTRNAVHYTTHSYPFDTSAAVELLRYSPPYSLQEAVEDSCREFAARMREHAGVSTAAGVAPRSGGAAAVGATVAGAAAATATTTAGNVSVTAVDEFGTPAACGNPTLPLLTLSSTIFTPLRLRGLTLRNRIMRAATFEGMCPGGVPSDDLVTLHERVAAGGAALTTVAYGCVAADGAGFETQLLMDRDGCVPGLRRLTAAVHRHGGAACLQLTHAGYFASRRVTKLPTIGASRVFNPGDFDWPRAATDADIARLMADFASAARRAVAAGFDAVEVHCGHGYLLSQWLSPYTNRRTDGWGGSLANRLRFPTGVIRAVRAAVGESVPIIVKFNLSDGVSGGLTPRDAPQCAQAFEAAGVDMLVPSGGFVTRNGFMMLRGPVPLKEMILGAPTLVRRWLLKLFGRFAIPEYPFDQHFWERDARRVAAAVKRVPVALGGGVCSLDRAEAAVGGGEFGAVYMARALLREPAMVNRVMREVSEMRARPGSRSRDGDTATTASAAGGSLCDHCQRCVGPIGSKPLACVYDMDAEGW